MDRLIYGNLPLTLQGQKNLALIGHQAVGLSNQICKNIFFRKGKKEKKTRPLLLLVFR